MNDCTNHEVHVLFEHGVYLKMLKMSLDLFVWEVTRKSVAAQTDHYADVFVREKVACAMRT